MGSEAVQVLTIDTLNPNVRAMRQTSSVYTRKAQIEKELKAGVEKPFTKVFRADVGDCQGGGQKPITFIRQVMALCSYPELLNSDEFPADAKERAKRILGECLGNSIGAYTSGWGLQAVRADVADYIARRDGHASDSNDIVLSTGASDAIRAVISLLLTGKDGAGRAGYMISVPHYPLYSASIVEFGAYPILYCLDEESNWSVSLGELEMSITDAKTKCKPRALVVINPGNPTGSVLSKENIREIIKFAFRHRLFLIADEVYQHNVWARDVKFISFKKVLMEMGFPYNKLQLASFMSASKGYAGECGARAGCVEVINLEPEVKAELFKILHVKLCPPVLGQAVLDCIVNPPKPGEPSYDRFIRETTDILSQLRAKAEFVTDVFKSVTGITCNKIQGAMYAFPRIFLPEKAVQAADAAGQAPDVFYCLELLEQTGISSVPGSSFWDMPGTYHIRISILPQMEELKPALEKLKEFHLNFLARYE
ncbi:alanine aminotransferase 2 [Plakobranchus ocellatus]|uniref:alanine transaminase n=1 Tax=Plakobranchus ocellatus TaxID=259542 RepID=A0AAV4BSS5_9GAST|nr:alanine aminotransferase 2 [Plakobranchus ocellatus]